MSDWQKGDLALCINAKDEFDVGYCLLELGQVYTVVGVDLRDADIWGVGLYLAEVTAIETGSHYGTSFGRQISKARKAMALSQKELAARIMKEEDGTPISPQYLNDIEHDRRSPTSDHLIRQFAEVLNIDEGVLFLLAGKIPDDLRSQVSDPAKAAEAFVNFRRAITN